MTIVATSSRNLAFFTSWVLWYAIGSVASAAYPETSIRLSATGMSLGLVIEMSPEADDCAATMGLVTLMSLGVAAGWQLSGDSVEALHQLCFIP